MSEVEAVALAVALGMCLGFSINRQMVLQRLATAPRRSGDFFTRLTQGAFSATLLEVIGPNDVLWIHDYHLMLLPSLVRKRLPKIGIGFFLHIPFPQFEIYRLLPAQWRREILEGLLGADVVGFHTQDYAKYFLGCVQRILGYKQKLGQLLLDRRIVKVGAFPMGVDFGRFHGAALSPEVQQKKQQLRKSFGDTKIILSVDRQDYSKGIIHRLEGYQSLLEKQPQWRGKVTLLMIVVPSRTRVLGPGRCSTIRPAGTSAACRGSSYATISPSSAACI